MQAPPRSSSDSPAMARHGSNASSRTARRAPRVSGTTRTRRNSCWCSPAQRGSNSPMVRCSRSAPATLSTSRRVTAIGSSGPTRTARPCGSRCSTNPVIPAAAKWRAGTHEDGQMPSWHKPVFIGSGFSLAGCPGITIAQRCAMPNQLPNPGEVFLDHTAFFVPAMDAAADALERCGFRLTPFTVQTNREGGATVPSGTGNRCAMLKNGYLELLTATSDTPLSAQLRERIADHAGLHLAAFTTADAAAEHRRLAAAGFPTLPLVDMRRPVGDDFARFTIARIAHGTMPEGRAQFLTHHTEPLVWLPDMLDHPNGAEALTALWIAADDPAEPAERFAQFTGRPARDEGAVTTIALDRGALNFATPAYLANALGIVST